MPIEYPTQGWYLNTTPGWITWNTSATTANYLTPSNQTATSGTWNYTWRENLWSNNVITVRDEDWYTVGYETPDPRPVTDADIERAAVEIEVAARQIQGDREARAVARTEAISRATALLLQLLSEEQAQRYRLTGTFEVIGSAGNVYRINRGISGNIEWIRPDGQVGARLCAHPTMAHDWLPEQDVALAQMLALTTDEPAFIRMANVHAGTRPPIGVAA